MEKDLSNIIIGDDILILTKMNPEMAYDVWQNSLDDDNRRFVPDEVFETLQEAKEVIDFIIDRYNHKEGPFIYAVIRKKDNANIGYVQLVQILEGWEIGYHIAKKYTGHGYATRAVKLYVQYLKEHTEIKEVYGIALADNIASRKVLTKCGFKFYFEGDGDYQGHIKTIVKSVLKLD